MTGDDWSTREGLREISRRRSERIAGWRAPVAFAVGYDTGGGWEFPHVNRPGSGASLSAVVLAEVVGHSHGTREFAMTPAQVAHAIENLKPAEATTDLQHPNLAAWRAVADAKPERIAAVFVGDLTDPPAGPADTALRRLF
ncbi:hypothetical protein [Mycobacterium sp. ACS4331]|uniref:hypothetical protein n=1 Tax=Mycobacterium sp. ACS4331 TaxID=1834121 RepID=UPI0007FE0839|nr:hypothetical protein [Mycobacterium sp. ACS4331]OBF19707.1 hypothetical protein A5727_10165 [Mycobacterium sp. ACS4331]